MVERAYLAGELQQLEETRLRLGERLTQLTRRSNRLAELVQAAEKAYTAKAQALNALEHVGTMLAPHPSLNSVAKPVLKRNMFGRLGSLRDFLESELRASSPSHLSTPPAGRQGAGRFQYRCLCPGNQARCSKNGSFDFASDEQTRIGYGCALDCAGRCDGVGAESRPDSFLDGANGLAGDLE